jgi:Uncharacterized low-complexity proteins
MVEIPNDDDVSPSDIKREADLTGADLSDACLFNADLGKADLHYADLSDADLTDADLTDVDLSDADLRNADLTGADLPFCFFFRAERGFLESLVDFFASLTPQPIRPAMRLVLAPVPWTTEDADDLGEGGRNTATVSYFGREITTRLLSTVVILLGGGFLCVRFADLLVAHPIFRFPTISGFTLAGATLGFGALHGLSNVASFLWDGLRVRERDAVLAAGTVLSLPALVIFPAVWLLWILTTVVLQVGVYFIGHFATIGQRERRLYQRVGSIVSDE